jgi:beta-1,4-N-acetylglucosaminyltransferase
VIFVTVGTSNLRFDRLLKAVSSLELDERVVVQCGPGRSLVPRAVCVDYFGFADFECLIQEARVVVSHAGIGTVALCLQHGRRPFLVPRRRSLGEAADDHQLGFARRLAADGLAIAVEDVDELDAALAKAPLRGAISVGLSRPMAKELIEYISRSVHRSTHIRYSS